jgi:hypothetical protein
MKILRMPEKLVHEEDAFENHQLFRGKEELSKHWKLPTLR